MCSYGIGNVGTYDSSFTSTEIADQAFNNPAGRYNYEQLLEQAMGQSYIVTDLFESPNISETLYFTFLPNETVPTTEFLLASPPTAPPTVAPPPTSPSVPTNLSVSSIPLPTETPTNPNGDRVGSRGSAASVVYSCSITAMLVCCVMVLLL